MTEVGRELPRAVHKFMSFCHYGNQGLPTIAVSDNVLEDVPDANEERLWRQ